MLSRDLAMSLSYRTSLRELTLHNAIIPDDFFNDPGDGNIHVDSQVSKLLFNQSLHEANAIVHYFSSGPVRKSLTRIPTTHEIVSVFK